MKIVKCLSILFVLLFVSSCILFKKSERSDRIETNSSYIIISQIAYSSEQETRRSKIEGFVFDDYSKEPVSYGFVFSIDDNQYTTTIDSVGYFCLLLAPGEYKFKIISVGNKDLVTEPITLEENIQTQLKVYLGSDIMYELKKKSN